MYVQGISAVLIVLLAQVSQCSDPTVDLGYGVYQGTANATLAINTWLGIPFARPPTGKLRWQPPQPPTTNSSGTIMATQYGPTCYQASAGSGSYQPALNDGASEDCLVLNVNAPSNSTGPLPVLVWIHGGGYGGGSGRQDLSPMINTNDNGFVGVSIQYRLGAFGFLASDAVKQSGVLNAGLLDQQLALQWVQQYIHLFGGDKDQVTIGGESAGAGSVMLQDLAHGGANNQTLFLKTIAASPYLPLQHKYNDDLPNLYYNALANATGCSGTAQSSFACLQNVSATTLASANNNVSQSGLSGTLAFEPVTDGTFLEDLPSKQLLANKVNGKLGLFGNNADEGPSFVPGNITTEDDLVAYVKLYFPAFSSDQISQLLELYPGSNATDDPNAPKFATDGENPPYAITQGSAATGHQERADLIYGETTFVCPSYWLAQAYNTTGRRGYKYQFSVPPAYHATDVTAYTDFPSQGPYGSDLITAFTKIWGNFIVHGDPSITNLEANGVSTNNNTENPTSSWPEYSLEAPYQININTTCTNMTFIFLLPVCIGENRFALVDASTWEDGRSKRCDFWRSVGQDVPEK